MTQKYYVERLLPLYCDAIKSMKDIDDKTWLITAQAKGRVSGKKTLYCEGLAKGEVALNIRCGGSGVG